MTRPTTKTETPPSLLGGLGLAAGALVVTLALLEFVVFRYILVPDDLLANITINDVVRYQPGTQAVFRHPDGRETLVRINEVGFNATRSAYPVERTEGIARIAVIGDSYVHGAFVDVDQGFPERLEAKLNAAGHTAEVFRFGMDGAPLSQHLHVLRKEVVRLKPDVVVIPLIHNDFDEMYRGVRTRYASAFMKLERGADGGVVEIAPAPFQPGLADRLRAFATFRYLYYETNLYLHAKSWVSRYFWGGEEEWEQAFVSSAVDIRKINDHPSNRFFTRYVMGELKALAATHGFRLAFVMDGVREAIYEGRSPMDYEVGRLNTIARDVAGELSIPFVDLQGAFTADYAAHRQRFEFPYDWHWNERGNEIVADVIERMLIDRRLLPEGAMPQARGATNRTVHDVALGKP